MKEVFDLFKRKLHYQIVLLRNKYGNLNRVLKLKRRQSLKNTQGSIFVSIRDFNNGRYGFQLINYFSKAGYNIYFKDSLDFLINLMNYDKMIFDLPGLYIYDDKQTVHPNDIGLVLNTPVESMQNLGLKKILRINWDYFNDNLKNKHTLYLPYYIHPIMNQYLEKINLDDIPKKGNILFYGEADAYYDKKLISDYFKMLSRPEVYRILDKSILNIRRPKSYMELSSMLKDGNMNYLYFIDSKLFRIPENKWLETLAKFNFFVATPGGVMPVCHNVIEAISVNTIPILQYPHFFKPDLQDNVNCVVFNDEESLIMRIKKLNLDNVCLENYRANLRKYYFYNIYPPTFRRKIESMQQGIFTTLYNAEELSVSTI